MPKSTEANLPEPKIDTLWSALLAFQAKNLALTKDSKADVKTKSGSQYSYKYASLPEMLTLIRPALSECNLLLIQTIEDGKLVTQIGHSLTQESIKTIFDLAVENNDRMSDVQALGSTITYLRRYAIQVMLGLAADDDDDGASSNYKTSQKSSYDGARTNDSEPEMEWAYHGDSSKLKRGNRLMIGDVEYMYEAGLNTKGKKWESLVLASSPDAKNRIYATDFGGHPIEAYTELIKQWVADCAKHNEMDAAANQQSFADGAPIPDETINF